MECSFVAFGDSCQISLRFVTCSEYTRGGLACKIGRESTGRYVTKYQPVQFVFCFSIATRPVAHTTAAADPTPSCFVYPPVHTVAVPSSIWPTLGST